MKSDRTKIIEKENKIIYIRKLLINKLNLVKCLNKEEFLDFCNKLTNYLRQDRSSNLLSYTEEEIEEKVDKLIIFLSNLGFNKKQIPNILFNNFKLLESIYSEEFLNKYVLLSVIENDDNTVRKELLQNNAKIFNKSLEEFYARFKICEKSGIKISKTLLIGCNYNVFIKHFVSRSYIRSESHKFLTEAIPLEKLKDRYPIDYNVINELKKDEKNKNVSFNRVLSKEEKIKLAIENYYKVDNLRELEKLLNITDGSLQRYLHDDSKKYVSKEEYLKIREWLSKAKEIGLSNGGKTSQKKYNYTRDEQEHFKGLDK